MKNKQPGFSMKGNTCIEMGRVPDKRKKGGRECQS